MSASDEHGRRIPDRWEQLRHAVIGSLLASPPERGALRARLAALAAQPWTHPVTGDRVHFGRSTIERWFLAARKERRDPLAALARKVRCDRGQPTAIGAALAARISRQSKRTGTLCRRAFSAAAATAARPDSMPAVCRAPARAQAPAPRAAQDPDRGRRAR